MPEQFKLRHYQMAYRLTWVGGVAILDARAVPRLRVLGELR